MIIGITGGIGAGKSTVISLLRNLGYFCIEADDEIIRLFKPNTNVWNWAKENLPARIFKKSDESINRDTLRYILTPELRIQFDAIIVPSIWNDVQEAERMFGTVFFSSARLLESQFPVHRKILVKAGPEVEYKRAVSRGTDPRTVITIQNAKKPFKIADFDEIIFNNGSMAKLGGQVDGIHQWVLKQTITK
jgi:dephospho-CoA kinase